MTLGIKEMYQAGLGQIGPVGDRRPTTPAGKPSTQGPSEFNRILETEKSKQGLTLSQHAETRIRSREIAWSPALEKRIVSGIEKAEAKGSREALILADDIAVIANIKSRTVVTAMDRAQLKDRVFTNIDSAVLV